MTTKTQQNSATNKIGSITNEIVPHKCAGVYMLQVDHGQYHIEKRPICYIGQTSRTFAQRVSEHISRLFEISKPIFLARHIKLGLEYRSL